MKKCDNQRFKMGRLDGLDGKGRNLTKWSEAGKVEYMRGWYEGDAARRREQAKRKSR